VATAYITEYRDNMNFNNLSIPKWSGGGVTEQTPVAVSGTSAQSAAFDPKTRYIQFTCDVIFSWTIGSNPTSTTSKMRFPADTIFFIGVQPGDKIAFITNT
jgi:hypothetical protein